jgi:hypothetical protein
MRTGTWLGSVELFSRDGTFLDEARARLATILGSDQTVRWRGELRATIRAESIPWPADEPVRLRFPDGQVCEVCLEPGVIDEGPILLQVARVSVPTVDVVPSTSAWADLSTRASPSSLSMAS